MTFDKPNQLNTLKSVVNKTAKPVADMDMVLANDTITAIGRFDEETVDMPIEKRQELLEKVLNNHPVNYYNRDAIRDARGRHHPGGLKASMKERKVWIDNHLSSISDGEAEGWLRDNMAELSATLTPEDLSSYDNYFWNTKDRLDAQAGFKDKAASVLEFSNTLEEFLVDADLDPDRSIEAHTQSFLSAHRMGLIPHARITNGTLHIPHGEKGMVPAFTIPANTDARDEFDLQTLLAPIARPLVSQILDKKRTTNQAVGTETSSQLFDNLKVFPEDMRTAIIVDHAFNSDEDKTTRVRNGIRTQLMDAVDNGSINSVFDAADLYQIHRNRIIENISERVNNGRTG